MKDAQYDELLNIKTEGEQKNSINPCIITVMSQHLIRH